MVTNVGYLDRALRIATGLGLMVLAYAGTIDPFWGYLGAIPLATGLAGTCPFYRAIGFSTCSTPS